MLVEVYMYKDIKTIKSGGIEVRGLIISLGPRRSGIQSPPILERNAFISLKNTDNGLSKNPVHVRMHAICVATHPVRSAGHRQPIHQHRPFEAS